MRWPRPAPVAMRFWRSDYGTFLRCTTLAGRCMAGGSSLRWMTTRGPRRSRSPQRQSHDERTPGASQSLSMNDTSLHGRAALVTGASSGIGAEFARQLAERGCNQVASIGAYQPSPTYASYSAAKSYILSFGE